MGREQHLTFTTTVPHHHANMMEKNQLTHNVAIIEYITTIDKTILFQWVHLHMKQMTH